MNGAWIGAVAVGFVAGCLSGQFGIGGALITTPAIRLLLGGSELVAVGTPLLVIIPTAAAGAVSYARRSLLDARLGLTVGLVGAVFSILGAWLADLAGGRPVLLVTAGLIGIVAADTIVLATRPERPEARERLQGRYRWLRVIALGVLTGLYSGFLGLGGGFIVVPALVRFFGFDAKRAIGTSLLVVLLLAVPGSVAHYALGHVDLGLAAMLSAGVIPGALLGARVTALARERTVRIGFAVMLLVVGALLAITELGWTP